MIQGRRCHADNGSPSTYVPPGCLKNIMNEKRAEDIYICENVLLFIELTNN
jgi:hypothetical protein